MQANKELSLISEKENWSFQTIKCFGLGYGGQVFQVDTPGIANGQCVIKIIHHYTEPSIEEEIPGNRVYGGRWSNFLPAYNLMKENNLPVPDIYKTGMLENFDYIAMEYLPGVSIREYFEEGNVKQAAQLHSITGTCLGKLHAIQRKHQGWINEIPYPRPWKDDFLNALENNIKELHKNPDMSKDTLSKAEKWIESFEKEWTDPPYFVLSHTDGLQGIAEYIEDNWQMRGIIDIEDHQFTDQRFVLAGHELAIMKSGQTLPPAFWKNYQKQTRLDPNYNDLKKYFMLFYLTSWVNVLSDEDLSPTNAHRTLLEKVKSMLERLLL